MGWVGIIITKINILAAKAFFPGDWQCSNCGRQGCWSTRHTCYRCGAPRVQGGNGNSPQGGFGGLGRGGQHQGGGVATGMSGMREVGFSGRNQQFPGGGGPAQRRRGGGNKVEAGGGKGVPGAGVGSFGISAWLGEGGNGGLEGGGARQEPHAVGLVVTEREKAAMALNVLREILGEDMGNLEDRVFGKLPPEKAPTPPSSPTEQQRAEKYVNLLRQHERLMKGVEEGKGRLEKARAEVVKEEERLGKLEKELKDVELQVEAHKAETRERENRRREKERAQKGPLIGEVGSEMDVTEDGGGTVIVLGKVVCLLRLGRREKGRGGRKGRAVQAIGIISHVSFW